MASPFYTAEHEAYRDVVRRFVEKEIEPYAHEWDEEIMKDLASRQMGL